MTPSIYLTQPRREKLPLFPYTTLFRSNAGWKSSSSSPRDRAAAARGHNPGAAAACSCRTRSEEHTSELQSRQYLVCRLLLEKKKNDQYKRNNIIEIHRAIVDIYPKS